MLKQPLVSIIIPSYNRADLIEQTLESIVAQTYTNWECLIIDDGSSDNTEAVVSNFVTVDHRFHFFKRPNEHKPGGNGARNFGFIKSKGDCVIWFDSDDVMLPEKLRTHLDLLSENQFAEASVTKSYLYNFKTQNAYLPWREKLFSSDLINDFISLKAGWQTGDVLWIKEALTGLSFNENLLSFQDWEFHLKALFMDKKIVYKDVCMSYIRHTPNSIKTQRNTEKIKSQFYAIVSILELNKKYSKINNTGYQYIFSQIRNKFRFFVSSKDWKLVFQSSKWLLKISLNRKFNDSFINKLLLNKTKTNNK